MKQLSRLIKYIVAFFKGTAHFEEKGNTAVVCVGMERSGKYGSCPGAGVDSERMQKILSKYGQVDFMQNSKATVSSVRNALIAACQKDLCIFFYSGHGGRVRNPKAADGSGYSEYLCLNNGALYDYSIWDVVSKAKGRVVMVFDCCHSATMFRTAGDGDTWKIDTGFPFSMLEHMATAQSANNILVWSGCPADNYSYGDSSGGVLTNGILKAYNSSRSYDEVWRRASASAASQRPVRTVLGKGFDGPVFR